MDYTTFKSQILSMLQEHFKTNASIMVESITKNNAVKLDGLIIQENSVNITPTLYLDYYYDDFKNGDSLEQIFSRILSDYEEHKSSQNMDLSFFTQYDQVKYQIVFKLIHYDSNKELLEQAPHFKFLDLAIVFSCLIADTPKGSATILILNSHIEYWHVDKDELFATAKINTPALLPCQIYPLEKLIHKMMPDSLPPDFGEDVPLYVLSNNSNLFGAANLLYPEYISVLAREKNCDFYILPSSIHEVLLMPASKPVVLEELNLIIRHVNRTHLQKEEILSDHPYLFSKDSGQISIL